MKKIKLKKNLLLSGLISIFLFSNVLFLSDSTLLSETSSERFSLSMDINDTLINFPLLSNGEGENDLYLFIDDLNSSANWETRKTEFSFIKGTGTLEDPYRIENLTATEEVKEEGGSPPTIDEVVMTIIHIVNSDKFFEISNNTFSGYNQLIYFKNVTNALIINNTFMNLEGYYQNATAITLDGSIPSQAVENVTIMNNTFYGLKLGVNITDYCQNNDVYLNHFSDNLHHAKDTSYQFYINKWDNGTIGNYWDDYQGYDRDGDGIGDTPYNIEGIVGTEYGVDNYPIWDITPPEHWYIENFRLYIDDFSTHNTWEKTKATNYFINGSGTEQDPYIIKNLIAINSTHSTMVDIQNSHRYFIFKNCTFIGGTEYSLFFMQHISNGTFDNCTFRSHTDVSNAIYMGDHSNMTITNCKFKGFNAFSLLTFDTGLNLIISDCFFMDTDIALNIRGVSFSQILRSSFVNINVSINLQDVTYTLLEDLYFTNISFGCIGGLGLTYVTIRNIIAEDISGVFSQLLNSNYLLVDNISVKNIERQYHPDLETYMSIGFILVFVSNSELRNIDIEGSNTGLVIVVCSSTSINTLSLKISLKENTLWTGGVLIADSNQLSIEKATIESSNREAVGIYIGFDPNMTIPQPDPLPPYQIKPYCSEVKVSDSTIRNFEYAFIINGSSTSNTITKSTIRNNKYGIFIDKGSTKNEIYYNTFVLNTIHAIDNGRRNIWDDGVERGNYWDDYEGYDNDGDGIGDTPYKIEGSANAEDRYPIWDVAESFNFLIIGFIVISVIIGAVGIFLINRIISSQRAGRGLPSLKRGETKQMKQKAKPSKKPQSRSPQSRRKTSPSKPKR